MQVCQVGAKALPGGLLMQRRHPRTCSRTAARRASCTTVRPLDLFPGLGSHGWMGDPVCWLGRLCPECGAMPTEDSPDHCWRCGEPITEHQRGQDMIEER